MNKEKDALHPEIIYVNSEKDGVQVRQPWWCSDAYSDSILGFANNIRTVDGGTHIEGLKTVLTRTLNAFAKKLGKRKESDSNLAGRHSRGSNGGAFGEGSGANEGQTKTNRQHRGARIVDNLVGESLSQFLEFNPSVIGLILEKAIQAFNAAEAARRAVNWCGAERPESSTCLKTRRLQPCDPGESEIYIVEGDSAGGSAKQGRDRRFQAILPLRADPQHREDRRRQDLQKHRDSGSDHSPGPGDQGRGLRRQELRYHRVVIMTDADVDGAHIRTGCAPSSIAIRRSLLRAVTSTSPARHFTKWSAARTTPIATTRVICRRPWRASREGQLHNPALQGPGRNDAQAALGNHHGSHHPHNETVEIEDALEADRIFTILMGDKVAPRREFIETHSAELDMAALDI